MITWANIVAIAPGLAFTPLATQDAVVAAANRQVDDDAWGEFADDGRALLGAHLASIRAGTGFVTQESLGQMSRSYGMPPGVMGSLAMSAFGAEYQRLLELAVGPAAFVP